MSNPKPEPAFVVFAFIMLILVLGWWFMFLQFVLPWIVL